MIRNIVFVFKRAQRYIDMWSILRAHSDISFQFITVKTVNNLYFFFFLRHDSVNKSSLLNKSSENVQFQVVYCVDC
jgi:hypothetical protein